MFDLNLVSGVLLRHGLSYALRCLNHNNQEESFGLAMDKEVEGLEKG